MEDKQKEAVTLLRVLAIGSTDKVRALLKKYGESPVGDYKDLELKLAQLYRKAPDKITLEKEFVAIHPHKDLIFKYKEPDAPEPIDLGVENLEVRTAKKYAKEAMSGCDGCGGACGKSSADGGFPDTGKLKEIVDSGRGTKEFIIGAVGIVAIAALFLHYNKTA